MRRLLLCTLAALAALTAAAFRTDTVKVATKHLSSPLDVTIVVPDRALAGTKCPSVYMLNGYDGNHLQWLGTQPELGKLADSYGMIFVLPDGRDSWYWDSPLEPGMQMESFIVKDLVPYVDSHYNTITDRSKRAITGLSMGGQGAMWLGGRHPEIWGNVGSTSGAVDITKFPNNWGIAKLIGKYDNDPEVWNSHSVISLVPAFAKSNTNIIFDCGVDDFLAEVNDNLHEAMVKAGVKHDFISRPGKHAHSYWRNAILYQLLFFNEAFKR